MQFISLEGSAEFLLSLKMRERYYIWENSALVIITAANFFLYAWVAASFAKRIDPYVLRIGFGMMTVAIGVYIIVSARKVVK